MKITFSHKKMKAFTLLFVVAVDICCVKAIDSSTCINDNGELLTTLPFGVEGDCDNYYQCSNGALVTVPCPPGQSFNPEIHVCDYPNRVQGCEHKDGLGAEEYYCRDSSGDVIDRPPFLKEGTCDVFYQCVQGYLYETKCPSGLVFNTITIQCDWPQSVPDCTPGPTRFPSIHSTQTTTSTTTSKPPITSTSARSSHTTSLPISSTSSFHHGSSVATTSSDSKLSSLSTKASLFNTTKSSVSDTTRVSLKSTLSSVLNTSSFPSSQSATAVQSHSSTTISSTASTKPPGKSYVAFVVDDTGSMSREMAAVKQWMSDCIDGSFKACANAPTGGWIVTSFNDPHVGSAFGPTTDVKAAIDAVDKLRASGGGDCPELGFSGLKEAASTVPEDNVACKVYFFTDAIAKDVTMEEEVSRLFIAKGCTFIPLLTGCCGDCEDPCISTDPEYCINSVVDERSSSRKRRKRSLFGYISVPERSYYKLAEDSGGSVYITDKPSSSEEMLEFLEEKVTLGFCPTEKLAGPLPLGYENEDDCNVTEQCWDRSVKKCYCMSLTQPCPDYPVTEDPECLPDDPHSFHADPTDCGTYIECASGNMWKRPCAIGTVFDPDIGNCNHPYNTAPPCGTLVRD